MDLKNLANAFGAQVVSGIDMMPQALEAIADCTTSDFVCSSAHSCPGAFSCRDFSCRAGYDCTDVFWCSQLFGCANLFMCMAAYCGTDVC